MKVREIIFFGTGKFLKTSYEMTLEGTSGCVPQVHCLTEDPPKCQVCLSTIATDANGPPSPLQHRNKRLNTSVLVRYGHEEADEDGKERYLKDPVGTFLLSSCLPCLPCLPCPPASMTRRKTVHEYSRRLREDILHAGNHLVHKVQDKKA